MQDKAVKSSKQTNVLATGNDSDDDVVEHEQWQYQQYQQKHQYINTPSHRYIDSS